jgi:regulator of protease activity HflC (stomatin/prohibitin superfamily)
MPEEAVMLTGDGNLVELQATVRFKVHEPRTYLFAVSNPDDVLRATAEAVLREAVASRRFASLLTVDREQFQQEVLARLERRCREEYGAAGLGIQLDGLAVHDLHPPQPVVDSYYEVTRAMEQRDKMITEAETDRDQRVRKARADKDFIIQQANAAREAVIRMAQADYRTLVGLYEVWQKHPELTEFLRWYDALAEALARRDKVILDAVSIAVHRLVFFDLDQPPGPVPAMLPLDRSPYPRGSLPSGAPREQ